MYNFVDICSFCFRLIDILIFWRKWYSVLYNVKKRDVRLLTSNSNLKTLLTDKVQEKVYKYLMNILKKRLAHNVLVNFISIIMKSLVIFRFSCSFVIYSCVFIDL